MTWTSVYNSDNNFVEIVYEGVLTDVDLKAEEKQSMDLAIENNTNRFIVDLTNFEKSFSIGDIYQMPSRYEGKLKRPIYIAVVEPLSKEARKESQFYELVCMNRGWIVKSFWGREQAIDWVAAKRSTKPFNNSLKTDAKDGAG